jgi:methyltransferase
MHMGEGAWLVAFLAAQRLAELGFAQWNTRRLRAAGGIEFGATHYPIMVALHVLWLFGLGLLGHGRAVDPFWLAVFVVLQAGRVWVIVSLGRRWTTRVIVLPGRDVVTHGPYRWVRHPNYLIVALEVAVVPLALGLPAFALAFAVANMALLAYRIHVESQALDWAALAARRAPATLANGYPKR